MLFPILVQLCSCCVSDVLSHINFSAQPSSRVLQIQSGSNSEREQVFTGEAFRLMDFDTYISCGYNLRSVLKYSKKY